ncbi:MAG: DNA polymerase III subunit delta [Bacteroidales bacterium]|nr:DNA polymerase III subunit delta [Bacteroidales bacterium]
MFSKLQKYKKNLTFDSHSNPRFFMKFSEIIGQEKIKKQLIQTVKNNRVSHAQLFFGPEGAGKLALAVAYAQYINCENKTESDSCGQCSSCLKYEKLIHPDLHFFFPVSKTKKVKESEKPLSDMFMGEWRELLTENDCYISSAEWYQKIDIEKKQSIINAADCAKIIEKFKYKAFEAEYIVVIIWMAEKIFHAAAPKILKIIEEPPEKTLFILISGDQDKILPTILSRTQLVKIPKVPDEELINSIKSSYNYTDEEIENAVFLAEGNYKTALKLIEESENENFYFVKFQELMRLCFTRDLIKINAYISEITKLNREQLKSFFQYALHITRNCLLINYNGIENVKLSKEEKNFLVKFSPFINSANGIQFAEEFEKALFHIERNAYAPLLFMDLSLTISKLLKISPSA